MKKLSQAGSATVILLALILVVALGGVGYYVYSSQNKDDAPTNSAQTSQSDTTASPASGEVLKLSELGIQIKLGSDVKDATSAKTDDGKVGLSTTTLEKFGDGCKAQKGSVALIGTFTNPDADDFSPSGNSSNIKQFPNAKNIKGTYYFIDSRGLQQSFCGTLDNGGNSPTGADDAISKAKSGFEASTIEALQ